MANNWAGIFELKKNNNGTYKQSSAKGGATFDEIEQILKKHFD